MKLIRDIPSPNLQTDNGHVVTIGTYDGIHLGHQRILKRLVERAHELGHPSLLLIFEPQPLEFFLKKQAMSRLSLLRDKLTIAKQLGVDKVLCMRFSASLANMSASQFIEYILLKILRTKHVVVGDNFAFGRNCSGGFELLQNYQDFKTEQIDGLQIDGVRVSSTIIRQALAIGDIAIANKFLGRSYQMSGHVSYGNRLGHMLGFPTANIHLRHKILPITGVYACKVTVGNTLHLATANVGTRPTVDGSHNLLEVHILNFDQDIYGQKISVDFLHKIREEIKFASLDQLKAQIKEDIAKAKIFFKDHHHE